LGSTYTNLQVRGEDNVVVKNALIAAKIFPVFVSKAESGWVSAYPWLADEEADNDTASFQSLEKMCVALSQELETAVFAFAVVNSDVFRYFFALNGKLLDTYDSWPGYTAAEALTSTPVPTGWRGDVLTSYMIPGTTVGAVNKVLSNSGGGLDSGLVGAGGVRTLKVQLVKTAAWWLKPFVWIFMSVIELLKRISPPSTVIIWRGVRLATAFATLMDLPPERINSGYKQIKDGTSATPRRVLEHVLSTADGAQL
jgi:hypothetical protein